MRRNRHRVQAVNSGRGVGETLETILADVLTPRAGVVRLPALVQGRLEWPPELSAGELASPEAASPRAWVIRRPQFDPLTFAPTGEDQLIVFPRVPPERLIDRNPAAAARRLKSLPFGEVLGFVAELRGLLHQATGALVGCAGTVAATAPLTRRGFQIPLGFLPALFDPDALRLAVDRELRFGSAAGSAVLDGWVPAGAPAVAGMTARMCGQLFPGVTSGSQVPPLTRALPTRQLHITAGNSVLIPVLSFLGALATKAVAVVKVPSEAPFLPAVLALAMHHLDPDHPVTCGTSFVYWKGGEAATEDILFAPGAFDRLVVWGDARTMASVRGRTACRTLYFPPRHGLSLIGAAAFPDRVHEAAVRAAADSLIADQHACTAALLHYVVAPEPQALAYCRVLQSVLAEWDRRLPHAIPRSALGRLRLLRRHELLDATWFPNHVGADLSSAVVYTEKPFDVSLHPLGRCVVVRRLGAAEDLLPLLGEQVSTVGVFPEDLREDLRDAIALGGVSNVLPLGECERAYAGMPHDGRRTLAELVNWANA